MRCSIKSLTLGSVTGVIVVFWAIPSRAPAQDLNATAGQVINSAIEQPAFLPKGENDHDKMRWWAWQQFLALNWPALSEGRGQADPSRTLGDMDGNRVWETWMPKELVFLPRGKQPPAWPNPPMGRKILGQPGKVHSSLRHVTEIGEAVGGDLLDQNCNYLRFHVLINETMFNAIREKQWYNAFEQLASPDAVEFPAGSIELKAAWKILVLPQKDGVEFPTDPAMVGHTVNCAGPKFEDDPRRYLTAPAVVYEKWNPDTQTGLNPLHVTVGLVGIHIVTKDPNRPQRLWSTFEQVDNVKILPEYEAVRFKGKPLHPSLFNPKAPKHPNYRPNLRIHYQTDPNNPVPVQVNREIRLPKNVNEINTAIRGRLKAVFPQAPWQYYQLIDIQFPTDPEASRDGDPRPLRLGNAAIETFNQSESSCLGCHSFARPINKFELSDFSWIMGQANWPERKIPGKTDDRSFGRRLFAYMTQSVPYAQPFSPAAYPKGGPFYTTWKSFPDSKWNTYRGFMAGENPHGAATRIYINDIAREFADKYQDDSTLKPEPFPEGSIILKENHRSWLPGNLVEFTAMLKREKGYDLDAGDWFWLKASPSGKIWREGRSDGCITCHQQPNKNFMLSWNYGNEPYRHNYPSHMPLFPRPDVAKSKTK